MISAKRNKTVYLFWFVWSCVNHAWFSLALAPELKLVSAPLINRLQLLSNFISIETFLYFLFTIWSETVSTTALYCLAKQLVCRLEKRIETISRNQANRTPRQIESAHFLKKNKLHLSLKLMFLYFQCPNNQITLTLNYI